MMMKMLMRNLVCKSSRKTVDTASISLPLRVTSVLERYSTGSSHQNHDRKEEDGEEVNPERIAEAGESSEELTGRGKEALREGLEIAEEELDELHEQFEDMKDRAKHLKDRASH